MLKLFAAVLLLAVNFVAHAEWEPVGKGENQITYADIASVVRTGKIVKMWSLNDFNAPRPAPTGMFLSSKALNEYDCANQRARYLAVFVCSGQMGGGELISSNTMPEGWRDVVPDSLGAGLWKFACVTLAKKK